MERLETDRAELANSVYSDVVEFYCASGFGLVRVNDEFGAQLHRPAQYWEYCTRRQQLITMVGYFFSKQLTLQFGLPISTEDVTSVK